MTKKVSNEKVPKKNERPAQPEKTPAAGPHAKPGLTDYEKTPGTGVLPNPDEDNGSMQPTG